MKKYILGGAVALVLVVPVLVFAEDEITTFLYRILNWIDTLSLLLMALAFLFFLWGLTKFVLFAGDETARAEGKQIMFWGIIAFVLMLGVFGIVNVLVDGLGFEKDPNVGGLPQFGDN